MGALALRPADLRDFDGEARVQDLRLGEVLGYANPVAVRKLVRSHRAKLERHGAIFSAVEKFSGQRRGPASEVFYLNERQAYPLRCGERCCASRRRLTPDRLGMAPPHHRCAEL